ncbi:MAG: M48 family metallopeptidase [bacterium]
MSITFYSLAEANRRKTFFLIFFFFVLLAIVGYLVDCFYLRFPRHFPFPLFTSIAVFIATIQSLVSYYQGDNIILRSLGARPLNLESIKETTLLNVVEEMSIAAGIPRPRVYIIDSDVPNACAVGRDPQHASICVTSSLLDLLNREELQGVIGHEVAHIRNRDILTMTITAALLGAIIILCEIGWRLQYVRGYEDEEEGVGGRAGCLFFILFLVLLIVAPIIAKLVFLAVSRSREYIADAHGAMFTRNPLGLASALEKIAKAPGGKLGSAATAHLFIADPLKRAIGEYEGFWADLWSTHPPIQKRIELLKQMAI